MSVCKRAILAKQLAVMANAMDNHAPDCPFCEDDCPPVFDKDGPRYPHWCTIQFSTDYYGDVDEYCDGHKKGISCHLQSAIDSVASEGRSMFKLNAKQLKAALEEIKIQADHFIPEHFNPNYDDEYEEGKINA